MKKISIFMAMVAVALSFTSCKDDNDPVFQKPAEGSFVLNTPALADQYYELSEDNTIEFTTSQPDYGFVAAVHYSMEMALSQNPASEEDIYELTCAKPSSAIMHVKGADVAVGLCKLRGIDSEEAWAEASHDAMPVYFRAVAYLAGHEAESTVVSNWVELKQVKGYFAIPTPGYIYLIGDCGGWKGPDPANAADLASWRLFEQDDNIGSHIYSGVFNIPAGKAMFRFYTQLTGWDGGDSWGFQVEDSATDFEITDGRFESDLVNGKGSFNFPAWEGGEMTIVVNMAATPATVTIMAGAQQVVDPTYVYMVGNNAGWKEPSQENAEVYNLWRLVDTTGDGVYSQTFNMDNIENDELYCRFYQELNGWGAAQWSADAEGGNVVVEPGVGYPTYVGEGCFQLPGVNGKIVTVTLDTNANTVVFDVNSQD